MTLLTFYRFITLNIWGNLPPLWQRSISKLYASNYNRSFTKYIIKPYCKLNYQNENYLKQFRSATGSVDYQSFQDFFTRVYRRKPKVTATYIWPCEGLLCDYGQVGELPTINIKGDRRNIKTIFGALGKDIPDNYFFINVFLHNNNYHRIHAPVSGKIKTIEHMPGELILLRPWVHKKTPSLPAMRNERVNLSIVDAQGRPWFLSIVGGPAVGTIVLSEDIEIGKQVNILDEIGLFLLGSTCCMASPIKSRVGLNANVVVGQTY